MTRTTITMAMRRLRRQSTTTLLVVLLLGVGVGINAFVLALVHELVGSSMRGVDNAEIVNLTFGEEGRSPSVSYPNLKDIAELSTTLDGVAGYRFSPVAVARDKDARRSWAYLVTENYFHVLGVEAHAGRLFEPSDVFSGNASPTVVLSYRYWQSRFGGDPAVVGGSLVINSSRFEVVGITPEGFSGTEKLFVPDLWLPSSVQPLIEPGLNWLQNRGTRNLFAIARLRSLNGNSPSDDLSLVAAELERRYPTVNENMRISVARPGLLGNTLRGPLAVAGGLAGALAAMVLLVICINLTWLLLARQLRHANADAVILALGGTERTLFGMRAAEASLLAVMASLVATLLSTSLSVSLPLLMPTSEIAFAIPSIQYWNLIIIVASLAFGSAMVITLIVSFRMRGSNTTQLIGNHRIVAAGTGRGGIAFLTPQVAVNTVLVAGLLYTYSVIDRTLNSRLGFDPEGVTAVSMDLALHGYDGDMATALERSVLSTLRDRTGVEAVAIASSLPLSMNQSTTRLAQPLSDTTGKNDIQAVSYSITSGYFKAMRTALLSGRAFNSSDDRTARRVAILNSVAAAQLFVTCPR